MITTTKTNSKYSINDLGYQCEVIRQGEVKYVGTWKECITWLAARGVEPIW